MSEATLKVLKHKENSILKNKDRLQKRSLFVRDYLRDPLSQNNLRKHSLKNTLSRLKTLMTHLSYFTSLI